MTLLPGGYNSWFGMNTDDRKRLMIGLDGGYNRNDEGFAGYYGGPYIVVRPSGRFEVRLSSSTNTTPICSTSTRSAIATSSSISTGIS